MRSCHAPMRTANRRGHRLPRRGCGGARRASLWIATLFTSYLVWAPGPVSGATMEAPDAELRGLLIDAVSRAESFTDRFDAEIWLLDMSNRLEPVIRRTEQRLNLLRLVHREAARAAIQPELVLAVIQVESNFDRFAISVAGARGLMQIMPFWLKEIGRPKDNLFHVATNLRFGCTILRYYLKRENGHIGRALARYNGSVGKTWYPARVFKAMQNKWFQQ